MRFLIDRCAGRRLAEALAADGHDVAAAWTSGPDPGDAELLRTAAEERRILVTIDSDFGRLVYLMGAAHAGIIRLPDVPATRRIALMADLITRHGPDLPDAIVTIQGDRVRLSRRVRGATDQGG